MNNPYSLPILHNAVGIMTPLLLAAMGGLFTELAGMLNIALEGLLLTGSFFCVLFASLTGNLFLGVMLGIGVTTLLASVLAFVTLNMKANVFITGLATNLFAAGLTVVLSLQLFHNKGVIIFDNLGSLPTLEIPWLAGIPVLGDILAGHNIFVYLSWALLGAAWFALYRTPFGFRLRATGIHAKALESLGRKPDNYRFIAFLISGLTCGLGGAYLTLNLGAFVPNITSGRGWIALVVIYLGNKKPLGLFLAALVFGLAYAFSNYAQGTMNIPADFILALPYLLTFIAMVAYSTMTYERDS